MNEPLSETSARGETAARMLLRLLPWLSAACALTLYASTAAPWLTWANDGADGGDLITAVVVGGVPHPSGYPTYCLLARVFAHLPLGSVARRFNLFSATAAAGAVVLVSLCARQVLEAAGKTPGRSETESVPMRAIVPLGIALAVTCAPTLWSQATISEVYALNAFFVAALLYVALRRPTSPLGWGLAGALLGLGLGNHLTLLLVTPGLAILLRPAATPRRVLGALFGLLLGLSVYLYLPLAARSDPPINWGDPDTWQGFWWVVSGRIYHGYALSLPLQHLPSRLGAWLRLVVDQYTLIGVALALNGFWSWLESGSRRLAWGTALPFGLVTLYALLYDTADSYVYLIPAHLLVALWMAEGARSALAMMYSARWRRFALPIVAGLLLSIASWSLVQHGPSLDLRHEQQARSWAEAVEHALPPDALIITGVDAHTFTLHYMRWVENRRPDLYIIDGELLLQPWYVAQLSALYPGLAGVRQLAQGPGYEALDSLIVANLPTRPVYLANRREPLEQRYRIDARGPLLWQVTEAR